MLFSFLAIKTLSEVFYNFFSDSNNYYALH